MNIYSIEYQDEQGDLNKEEIRLPSTASEVKMMQWEQYQQIPVPQQLERLAEEEQSSLGFEHWLSVINYACKVLSLFSVEESKLLSATYSAEDSDGLLAMFIQTISVLANYQPKYRAEFKHNGISYRFPEVVQQSFNQKLIGGKMSMGMAVDALQIEHVLSATDEQGKFVMEDQKYWLDISVVAAISRKVAKGKVESVPLDWVERRKWLDNRIKAFEDLPMDIALDGTFFLQASKIKLGIILSSVLRLRSSLLMQLSSELSKPMPTNGTSGTGIASSMK